MNHPHPSPCQRIPLVARAPRVLPVLLLLCALGAQGLHAQDKKPPLRREYLSITAGVGVPLSHEPLTEFWGYGISAAASFSLAVTRWVFLGIGVEATRLPFDQQAFVRRYPGVEILQKDIGVFGISLNGKFSPRSTMILAPFLGASVGAIRTTPASYKATIGGVRKIYYDIPAKTRFTVGGSIGLDVFIVSGVWFEIETKACYVHDDPVVGVMLACRVGFQFRL